MFKKGDTIRLRESGGAEFLWYYDNSNKKEFEKFVCVGSSKTEKEFRKMAFGFGIAIILYPSINIKYVRALLTERCEEDYSYDKEKPF